MKTFVIALSTLLALTALMPEKASAQEAKDSVVIDLDKALEIALCDNADIRVADKTIETKKYAKKETITGLFPTITASATGTKNIILQKMKLDFSPEPISMGQPFVFNLTGTASVPVVAPQLWQSISLSEEQVQLALEQARQSKVNTIAAVKNAYYNLLLARASYRVLLASERTAQRNADDTKHKYEVGTVSEFDKLSAEVQLASIKPNVLSAANAVRLTEMNLKVLMGVDVTEPMKFEGSLLDYEENLFDELIRIKADTDLSDNSNLRQLDINERLLRMSEKINRLGYLPTLALQFSAGYQSMQKSVNPTKGTYFPSATLSVAFSWTIFDGFQKYMKSKQNKLSLESLDIQRENLVRQLELSVTSSLNNIETAAEQTVSNKEGYFSAKRAYEIAEKRYSIGSGTMLELNSSETDLINAQLKYCQSIYDFLTNRATLEQTLGKTITEK